MKTIIGTGKDTQANITIKVKGLDELIRNLGNPGVKEEFVDAANAAIAEVEKYAIAEVPVRTSDLQKSHVKKPATAATLNAEVYTEKEYAVPVHEGHRIVAWGRDTGRFQPANPWMERAVERAQSTIDKLFDQAADRVVRKIIS